MFFLLQGIIFGFLFAFFWERATISLLKVHYKCYFRGYHFHHSLLGIFPLLFVPIFGKKTIDFFLLGFSLGIILQHTLKDGLVFITKEKVLLIATSNLGKIKEIKALLYDLPLELKTLGELGFKKIKVKEEGRTLTENAILKAKIFGEKTGFLTCAEDSGLEVEALNGAPGVFSARYFSGSDKEKVQKLLKKLKNIPKGKRQAQFRSVVALFHPKTKEVKIFEGTSQGYITFTPRGENGFGYDPIFFNLDLGKTNAQATLEEKNQVSHRARAFLKMKEFLLPEILNFSSLRKS